jgi:peroxiredoxin
MLEKLKFIVKVRWLIAAGMLVAVTAGGAIFSHKPAAPVISLSTLKGSKLTLEQWRGKVVLVNFWATDCTGCIAEMPKLIETYRQFAPRGYEMVAVAMDYDRPDFVVDYTERMALPFTVALDLKGEAARAFDVHLTPTSFLIDKQGRIVEQYRGQPDFGKLRARVEGLLGS